MALRVENTSTKTTKKLLRREDVPFGTLFVKKSGNGTKTYLAIGTYEDSFISVNVDNGELAFSTKPDGMCALVGTGHLTVALD